MRGVGEDRRNDGTNTVVHGGRSERRIGDAEQNGMPETWLISLRNAVTARRRDHAELGDEMRKARHGDAADAGREATKAP